MKMNIKQKNVQYMKRRGLARAEMVRLIGQETAPLAMYLDEIPISPAGREWVEAALEAFFCRLEQRKSQDLEQFWSRVAVHDLLPGMAPSEVQAIVRSSLGIIREGVAEEIRKTSKGSIRRVSKLTARLKRLQELNPDTPLEKLIPIAGGQIIA